MIDGFDFFYRTKVETRKKFEAKQKKKTFKNLTFKVQENVSHQSFCDARVCGLVEARHPRCRGSNPAGKRRSRRLRPDAGNRRKNPEPKPESRSAEKPDPDVELDDLRLRGREHQCPDRRRLRGQGTVSLVGHTSSPGTIR